MKKVPLLDLKSQYSQIRLETRKAIDEVLESQSFILGSQVRDLEVSIADYCGCRFSIGVSSGTDALLVSLMALDIGRNCGVITTPYTFFSTAGSVQRVGARPIFVDIDPSTYNIDPQRVAELVEVWGDKDGVKLKAIIPVHLYGQCVDMSPILRLAENHGLRVIEDAAQAIGAEYKDPRGDDKTVKRAGSMADLGCLSFFPSKNLGGFGDGGMVTTDDEALCERVRILRVHGAKPKYYHRLVGGNFRLDTLQAAILLVKLRYLDEWSQKRRENAERYQKLFSESGLIENRFISPPESAYKPSAEETPSVKNHHIYNQYIIRAKERDRLRGYLNENGIGTEVYYPVPLHLQECFSHLGYKKGDFPESEKAASETLALPIYPELSHDMMEWVVDCINRFYKVKH